MFYMIFRRFRRFRCFKLFILNVVYLRLCSLSARFFIINNGIFYEVDRKSRKDGGKDRKRVFFHPT